MDIAKLLTIFAQPCIGSQLRIADFVQRVEETTSTRITNQVRTFFAKNDRGEIKLTPNNVCFHDELLFDVAWRKWPLRFELVNENNFLSIVTGDAADQLANLRAKRLALQMQLSQMLCCVEQRKH